MMFVDGSNFLVELSKELNLSFRADKPPLASFNLAGFLLGNVPRGGPTTFIRSYWFGSYQGNEEDYRRLCKVLSEAGFEPILIKKRDGREKGVDIALAIEMLANAFNQNYETVLLVAGDEDYVRLVNEVKRYGPTVRGAFFRHGLSPDLRLAFDDFTEIESLLEKKFVKLPELIEELRQEVLSSTA